MVSLLNIYFRFLDFGLLCRMEKKHQLAMLSAIVHIANGDWHALVYDLMEMDVGRPGTNLRRVAMVRHLEPYSILPIIFRVIGDI